MCIGWRTTGKRCGSFEPITDGLRLQAKGMLDSDERTAPTDEGDDHDDEGLVGATAMENGAGAGTKGRAADVAAVAPFFLAMHNNVA